MARGGGRHGLGDDGEIGGDTGSGRRGLGDDGELEGRHELGEEGSGTTASYGVAQARGAGGGGDEEWAVTATATSGQRRQVRAAWRRRRGRIEELNQNFHKDGLYRRSIGHGSWHKP